MHSMMPAFRDPPSGGSYVKSFAFKRRSSCGVNRSITDKTRTRFGLISLCSRNCKMTLRRYCSPCQH